MFCAKFPQKVSEHLINEMTPSVIYDHSWCFEAREDDLMEHPTGMLCSSAWKCLHPLGHIIHSNKDELAVMGFLEGSHEIDALNIE